MLKYLQETTVWDKIDYNIPGHIYVIDERKQCIGYIKAGTNDVIWFKIPSRNFSKTHRKFKDVTKQFA